MKKKTVGELSIDALSKNDEKVSVREQQEGMTENYLHNLIDCTEKAIPTYKEDFFILVLTKKEKLLSNVFRNYFFARGTCPTPEYDQSVYSYNNSKDQIEYLWTVPAKDVCEHLISNVSQVASEERELLSYVIQFYDGTLLEKAKVINGEMPDTPHLIN